jgi:transcriptional regulator with XRE-family HTH domain
MTIGQHINKARLDKDLTLDELAEKSGIPKDTIVSWIYGSHMGSIDRIIDLADALEISLDELVGRKI